MGSNLESSAFDQPSVPSSDGMGDSHVVLFEGFRGFLGRVERMGRWEVGWHGEMHVWLRRAQASYARGELGREAFEHWRRGWGAAFCGVSTCQGLAWSRNRGAVLDPAVVDRIESRWTATEGTLARWDDFFHGDPAIRAVRHRRDRYQSWLGGRGGGEGMRVLDLGCGPGWGIGAFLAERPEVRLRIRAVDGDSVALERCREVCGGGGGRVEFVEADPARYLPREGEVDWIWSGSLLERLGDRQAVMTVRRLWDVLPSGGELVLGNLGDGHSSRAYLEIVLGWQANPRGREDLLRLAAQAGIPRDAASVDTDTLGVGNYLVLAKR